MSDEIIKKDIKHLIEKETPNLNNLLSPEEVSDFQSMTEELRDTWTKKQMFRTETEARLRRIKVFYSRKLRIDRRNTSTLVGCQGRRSTNINCEVPREQNTASKSMVCLCSRLLISLASTTPRLY